uniref:Uncharacterized protein n=1 Tax=Lepeophtheirus salmonis TaxID=72036 RepID=A0A0K2T0L9_LEPSM
MDNYLYNFDPSFLYFMRASFVIGKRIEYNSRPLKIMWLRFLDSFV